MMASNGSSPPARRVERPSTEIVHSLFGKSVGRCWGDFFCSHYRQRGRLYAASNAICYFSNLFGFERRICLQLDDVTDIQQFRSTSIQITTVEGEQYIFKSFENRELVTLLLQQLKQGHANGTTRLRTDSEEESVERLDPLETSIDVRDDKRADKQVTDSNTALETLESTVQEEMPASPGLESLDEVDSVTTDAAIASDVPAKPADTQAASADGGDNPLASSADTLSEETNVQEEWELVKSSNDPPYNETSIDALVLPCTLDEFFALFLANNAPHSIDKYQRDSIGDSELTVSSWTREPDGSHERVIHFRHPLPSGLGPDSAHAERQQCFRRFGDFGFCLETVTSVKGVIASDCFHVLDKWLVEPTGETSVALTVKHQVQFTKRTLLKRVIQNTSNTEAHKWYKGYANMLESSFQDKEPDEEMDEDELKQHTKTTDTIAWEQEISMSSLYWSFEIFCTLMWLCLMIGIALLLLQMQNKIALLENQVSTLREEHVHAFARFEQAIQNVKLADNRIFVEM